MGIRRVQGWLLIVSAICLLLGRFLVESNLTHALSLIGTLLLIVSIPAIQTAQDGGLIGWIGILLIEIAALIALAFQLDLLTGAGPANILGLTSAIFGMVGRFLMGWLTVRRKTFPAWAGWAFLLSGVSNLLGGIIDLGTLAAAVFIAAVLFEAAALIGYGYTLTKQRTAPANPPKSTL